MSSNACLEIADLLVDFADGEVTDTQRNQVMVHLAICPHCSEELELLEQSLRLAKTVWQKTTVTLDKSFERLPATPLRATSLSATGRFRANRRWSLTVSMGACVSLLLLASVMWLLPRLTEDGHSMKGIVHQSIDTRHALSDNRLDEFVSGHARCARLSVAVTLLASQPGLERYKTNAERYLANVSSAVGSYP